MVVKLKWNGDEVRRDVLKGASEAMVEFGLRAETASKTRLQPLGRGVLTGTLRRSIHIATPGYNWQSDNVVPTESTPERGMQAAEMGEQGGKLVLELGSGMEYALQVHQDHPNAHHFIREGVNAIKPKLPEILERHVKLKRRGLPVIDPLEVAIKWLAQDADLQTLVSSRVASKHRYGAGWLVTQAGVIVRMDGGIPDLYAALQPVRLEIRAYAPSQQEAMAIWRRLVEISRQTDRQAVLTSNGGGLLYRFNQSSGPSLLYDQDIKLDFVLCFFDALVAESVLDG